MHIYCLTQIVIHLKEKNSPEKVTLSSIYGLGGRGLGASRGGWGRGRGYFGLKLSATGNFEAFAGFDYLSLPDRKVANFQEFSF